jgi:hypothetical protein
LSIAGKIVGRTETEGFEHLGGENFCGSKTAWPDVDSVVDGDHLIMNGEPQRLATDNDKAGNRAIF